MSNDRFFIKLACCMLILGVVAVPETSRVARGELVGYWNFDGNVDDHSGKDNHGELFDAVYSDDVPAAIGNGQSLDFSDDLEHVFIANENGDLDSEVFTLSAFIFDRGQVGALERITSREGDTFETALNVHGPFGGTGEYAYYSGAGGGWQWGEEVAAFEEWQHVAYVADSDEATMRIYVDGDLTWTSEEDWFTLPTGFMHIGNRWNDVEGFDGLIDDVAIWDEVLSEADIKTLASGGVPALLGLNTPGDVNGDGTCDAADIDAIAAAVFPIAVRTGDGDARYDVNLDGAVDAADHAYMVQNIKNTWFGDANLDGEFNSSDFVAVFQTGEYEDVIAFNSGWADGDWNGDGEFNSSDFVSAFQDGGFELGPKAVASVPEPASNAILFVGVLGVCVTCSRRRKTSIKN